MWGYLSGKCPTISDPSYWNLFLSICLEKPIVVQINSRRWNNIYTHLIHHFISWLKGANRSKHVILISEEKIPIMANLSKGRDAKLWV